MIKISLEEGGIKEIFKQALLEVIQERKDIFYNVLSEVIEDLALSKAILENDTFVFIRFLNRKELYRYFPSTKFVPKGTKNSSLCFSVCSSA